jgi:hypothetical protein
MRQSRPVSWKKLLPELDDSDAQAKRKKMTEQDTLMVAGKARWLLEGGIDELDDGERALLLALASLDADTGRPVTQEERKVLDQIAARSGADGEEITQAVKHMVEAKAKRNRRLDWSALAKRFRRK